MAPNARAALIALLAFALFATHDAIVKALGADYASFQIVFFSVLFGFPLVTLTLINDPAPGHLRPIHPWWVALRTIAAVTTAASAFYAFSTIELAQVYAIIFAAPMLITVLSIPILGERVGPRRWIAVIVGLAGVMVVLQPGATELSAGHLAALAAAVSSALASVISRKIGPEERSVVLVLYPMLANFAIMGALMGEVYTPMPMGDLALNAAIAALGFGGAMLLVVAYKTGEAAVVAPMQYSQILWATLYGAVFFEEVPGLATLLGAGIIIASGVYIVARESLSGRSRARPVSSTRTRHLIGTAPRIGALMRRPRKGPEDAS
ncbi:DMT family transporter [Roseivivax sediminis]|uniref:Permease of the drug/metabolite transporter (DMT) superfamily n=1 Tax=Roseivivax sediminis TaxID=936889 RepID=A0A1I1U504_9RHOB|nr:DMT family transporter [Roseivivax sediminis]SFD65931.1 Permease of the drug/metabolite transporter (DMT) superfamily [Roseivivax sediminis]